MQAFISPLSVRVFRKDHAVQCLCAPPCQNEASGDPLTAWEAAGTWALFRDDCDAWVGIFVPSKKLIRWKTWLRLLYSQAGLRATLLYRFSHGLWRARIPALPGIVARQIQPRRHGLYILHPVGTVVNTNHLCSGISQIAAITIAIGEPAL